MKQLTNADLKRIRGGFSVWIVLGIAALVSFFAGVIDGYVHPKSCGGD